jgi:hypothetical protein
MTQCNRCLSFAINHHCHGRDGSDPDLCDVCYWRKRAEQPAMQAVNTTAKRLQYALDMLVAAGHVRKEKVDFALAWAAESMIR